MLFKKTRYGDDTIIQIGVCMMKFFTLIQLFLLLFTGVVYGQNSFQDGPLINGFGKHAPVKLGQQIPQDMVLKVVFDVADSGEGELNRRFNSLARFLNMHVANGVSPDKIQLALVVHGKASEEMLDNDEFKQRFDQDNPNIPLLSALIKHKVQIFVCGQSASYYDISNKHLLAGVKMSLSAMTAHAILSGQGYSLNPF